jgi:hypothetical protein
MHALMLATLEMEIWIAFATHAAWRVGAVQYVYKLKSY